MQPSDEGAAPGRGSAWLTVPSQHFSPASPIRQPTPLSQSAYACGDLTAAAVAAAASGTGAGGASLASLSPTAAESSSPSIAAFGESSTARPSPMREVALSSCSSSPRETVVCAEVGRYGRSGGNAARGDASPADVVSPPPLVPAEAAVVVVEQEPALVHALRVCSSDLVLEASPVVCWSPATPELAALEPLRTTRSPHDSRTSSAVDRAAPEEAYSSHDASRWVSPQAASSASTVASPMADSRPVMASIPSLSLHEASTASSALPSRSVSVLHSRTGSLMHNCAHPRCDSYAAPHAAGVGREERPRGEAESMVQASNGYGPAPTASSSSSSAVASSGARPPRSPSHSRRAGVPLMAPTSLNVVSTTEAVADLHKRQSKGVADTTPTTRETAGEERRSDSTQVSFVADTIVISPEVTPRTSNRVPMRLTASEEMCATPTASTSLSHYPCQSAPTTVQRGWAQLAAVATVTSSPMSMAGASSAADTVSAVARPRVNASGGAVPSVPAIRLPITHGVHVNNNDSDRSLASLPVLGYGPRSTPNACSLTSARSTRSARSARYNNRYGSVGVASAGGGGATAPLPASVPGLKELFPTLPDELYLTRDRLCISQDARHCLGSGAYGTVRQAELYPPGVEAPPLFTPTAEMQSAHNTASIPSTPRFVMNILSSSHSSSSLAIAGAPASHAGGEGCERAVGSGGPPGATGGAAAPAAATGVAVGSSLEAGGAGYRCQRALSVFSSESASASNLPLHQQPYSERTASFYNGLDDVMRWGGVTEWAARPGASWECEGNEGGGGGDMRADAGDDVVEEADESLDVPLSAAQTAASFEKQDKEDSGVSEVRGSWQTRPLAWSGPQYRKCTAITPTDPESATRIGWGVAGGDDGDDEGRRLPRVLGLNMGYNAVHGAGVSLPLTSQLGGPEWQPRRDSECAGGGGCANNSDDDEVESDARREEPRELYRVVCTDDAAFSQRPSVTLKGRSRTGTAYGGRSATASGVAGNGGSGLPAPVFISRAVCSSDAEDGTITVGGAAASDTAAGADADGAEHSIASTTGTRTFASSHSPVTQGSTYRGVTARARRLRVAGEAGTARGEQGEDDEDEGEGSDASNPREDHSMSYFATRSAAFSSSPASTTSGGAVTDGGEPLRSPNNSAVPVIQVGALARRVTARPGPRVSFELGGVVDRDGLHTALVTTEARQTPSPTTSTSASGGEGRARVSPVADRLRFGGAPRMPAAFCDPAAMAASCAESSQSLLTPVTTPVAGQQYARSSRATGLRAALSVPLAAHGAGADGDHDDNENTGGQSGKARDGGGNAEATPSGVGEAAARGGSASASQQRSGADALDASRASFFASVSYPAVYTSLRGAGADDGAVAWAAGTVSAELGGAGASFYGGAAGDGTLNTTARHAIALAMLEAREEYEQHLVSPSPAVTEPELEGLEGDSSGRSLSTPSVQYRVSMAPQGDEESGGCSNGGGKGEGIGGVCTSPTSASQTPFPITGPSSVAPIPPAPATTSGTSEAARVAQHFTHLCTSRSSATPTSTTTATSTNVSVFHARPSATGGGDAVGPGIADGPRIPRTPPASWITPASFGAAALAAASGGAAGARGGGGGPAGGAAGPASLPQLLSTAPLPPQPTGRPGAKAEGQQHDPHSTTSQTAGAARRPNTSTNPLQQSFEFPRMPIVRFGVNASMVSDAAANGCAPFRSVATKVINKTDLAGNAMKLNAFHNELRMASRLHHPCLVNVFGAAEDADHFYLVMDLAEKGNLAEYQKQFGVRDTREMAPRFLADVVLALEYLRDGTQHSYWMPDPATPSAAATAAATRESAAAAGDAVGAAPAFRAAAVRRAMGGGGLTPTSARGTLVSKRLALSGSTTLTGLTGGETEASAVALGRPGGEVSFSHVEVLDAVTRRESMSEPSETTSRTPSVAPDLEPPATSSVLANDAAEPHVGHPPPQRREDEGAERGEDSVAVTGSAAAAAAAAPRRLMAPESIIIHRDLKPDNLLLTWDFHVKLADFGDACFLGDDEANSFGGTPAYISPEMVSRGMAGPYSDLWALGCVLYELLVGERLFPGTMAEVAMAVQRFTSTSFVFPTTPVAGEAEVEGGGTAATALRQLTMTTEQPSQRAKTAPQGRPSDAAQDLVRQLLQPTPEERLGAAERGGFAALKAHPFFAEVDWERVLETTNMTTTNTDYTVELAEYLDPEEVVVYCSPVRLLPATSTTATADESMTGGGGGGGAGGSSKAHSWNSNPAANSQSSLTNHTYSAIASGIGQSVLVMVLTDGPRLFLVNPDLDMVQFEIPWTPDLRVSVQRADRFTVTAPLLNGHTPPCSPHPDQPLSGTVGNSAASTGIVTYVFADRNRRADLWGVKIHHLQLTESGKLGERSGDGGPSTDASAPFPTTPAASGNMPRCYSTPVLGATTGARPGSVPHLPWFAAPSHFTHQQQQHAQRRGTPTMSPRSGTSLLMRLRTTPRTVRAGSLCALTTSIASEHMASATNTAAGTPCDPRSPALPGSSAELSGYACSNSGTINSSGGVSAARLTQVARARAASFAHGSLVSPTSIFTVRNSSTVATPATTSILVRSPELSQPTPAAPLGFPRTSVGSSASTPVTMVTTASSSTGDASRLTPPSSTPTASAVSFAAAAATQAPRHPPHVPILLHTTCPPNVGLAAHPDEPPLLLEPLSHSNVNSGNSSNTKSPLGLSATQREGGVHQAAPGSSWGPPPHPHPPPPPLAFSRASTSAGAISAASLAVSPTSATAFAAGSAASPQSATTRSASQWNSCTLTSPPTAAYDEAAAAAARPTEALASSTRSVQKEKASSTPVSVAGAALESSCSAVDLPAAQDVRVGGALTAATTMTAAPGDDSFGSNAVMTPQERLRNFDDGTPGPLSTPRCGERGQSLECKEHEGGRGGNVRGGGGGAVGVGHAGSRSAPISPLLVGCDATGTTAAVPPSWAVPRRASGATTPATSQARQQFQLAQKMKNKP